MTNTKHQSYYSNQKPQPYWIRPGVSKFLSAKCKHSPSNVSTLLTLILPSMLVTFFFTSPSMSVTFSPTSHNNISRQKECFKNSIKIQAGGKRKKKCFAFLIPQSNVLVSYSAATHSKAQIRKIKCLEFNRHQLQPEQKYKKGWILSVEHIYKSTTIAPRCMPIQPKVLILFQIKIFLHDIKQPSHCGKEKNLQI